MNMPAPAPAPAPAAPVRPVLPGIDVSAIGQGMNFAWSFYRGKIAFAAIKATQGTGFVDPAFTRNWQQAGELGIVRIAYHFLDGTGDGAVQWDHFASVLKPRAGDLIMLDHETMFGTPAEVAAAAVMFAANARHDTGAWPITYTDIDMATNGACNGLGNTPAFIANPSHDTLPDPLGPWSLISFEQTGQRGVDTDVFYGDLAQLERLAIPVQAPPKPKPATLTSWRLDLPPGKAPGFILITSEDGGKTWH